MATSIRTILAFMAAFGLALAAQPAAAASPEERVKAAYLYKLASFVRWPNESGREFRVCVAGSGEVVDVLRVLVRNERIQGAPVVIESLRAEQATRVRTCQILYLARGPTTAQSLLAAAEGSPVLTVADRNGGTRGGVIDFVIRDGKVRFAIDRTLARRQRLELSSKLLEIAVAVEP